MASCLLLLISAAVGIGGPSPRLEPETALLLAHGWSGIDQVGCAGIQSGHYYELGNEDRSVELYALAEGRLLVSRQPLPDAPFDCREISEPHFIEEIL